MWDISESEYFEGHVKGGYQWRNVRNDFTNWIHECVICQKIKLRTEPKLRDEIEYHLYHLEFLASLSVDTLGPLPEDENEFSFIVVIVDNFSKFVGLYRARSKYVERIYNLI